MKAAWKEPWWVVVEHPQYGEARVLCRWVERRPGYFVVKPVAVEFDLFTPPEEQALLVAEMETFVAGLKVEMNRVNFARPSSAPGAPKLT